MDNIPLYNSRIISTFIEYIHKVYPEINIDEILNQAGISKYEVADEGHWFTQQQVNRFYDLLEEKTGNLSISREAGRYIARSQSSGILRQYVAGFLKPSAAYWMLAKVASNISRHTTLKIKKLSSNKIEITATPKPGIKEEPFQCENRIGMFESMAQIFTKEYAVVEQPNCIHRGDKYCRYIVTWVEPPSIKWKQIAIYSSLFGVLVLSVLFFFLPTIQWIIIVLSSTLLFLSISFYSSCLERKELADNIESQGSTADLLVKEINTRYNESLLIQEIGQATSSILDIDKLLRFVMDTLGKRLDFDRGMIMLANKRRDRLVYTVGYGYNTELEKYLRETEFHLDKPHSKGEFAIAFKEQKPFLINDIEEIENHLSEKSIEFATRMGTQSFICVPIIYEGNSEGVLAVDNVQTKKPFSQSDLSLLMGIAPQIGISINNARSYKLIQEREKRFRALSENAPDIIYTLGIDGTFTYVNPSWENILGHKAEEVIGKSFIDFARKEDIQTYVNFVKSVKKNKEMFRDYIGILLNKDGSERIFNINGALNLDHEGNVIGLIGILKDITEQRSLEAQIRHASKMEAVGTLTGGIAHDFNNIMQAINSYNQLLMMKKNESDSDWKYLSNIGKLTQRSTDLIKELMIFSRKVETNLIPVNLNDEIEKLFDLLKNTIPKMTTINLQLTDHVNIINGDVSQIGQIIMNLAVNANDVMPDGGRLTIKTENINITNSNRHQNSFSVEAGEYVLMSISDTGPGMNKEVLEHIFEPFFTTKAVGKGTGLGLSVVYGIVKTHRGYIICESEPNKGTTFNIYFPALKLDYEETMPEIASKDELPTGNETILLVDDEKSIRETNQDILEQFGYNVITAENGEDAIEIFTNKQGEIDLVLLDLIMPGMGGNKCLLELINIKPEVKVIITSGYTASMTIQDTLNCGAAAFISKPMQLHTLVKEVRRVLDQKLN
jgi:PAS domain S-box-containing protein